MSSRSYPVHPGRLSALINQRLLPIAIDAAGSVEVALERVAAQGRRAPGTVVLVALAAGLVLGSLGRRRQAGASQWS